MSKPWDDPEEKFEKKIRKIGRTGAYAIGGSIGLWIILALFPKEEGHEKITGVIDNVVFMLFVYGCILFGAIIFKRRKAPLVNLLTTWIIIPSWLAYTLLKASGRL